MRSISKNKAFLGEGDILDGRYRIESCLGGGGMATVYRAIHTGLELPVAVKVVAPQIRDVPGITARFLREARAATRLRSEHVVRVFDVGTTPNGSPYFVMEALQGKDLGRMLEEGTRPSIEDAVDWVLQACEALAEVHGVGIVHRDLKPANLFLVRGPDGRACVKLIDFGISRIESDLLPKDQMALTSPDVAMGSPRYMPPEQMEAAGSVDSRSDIWGLGAILYELLTGDAPFDGESLWDIYAAAMGSPPPLAKLRPDLPDGFADVVLRCLRVEPERRFSDVAKLAAALAPFGDESAAGRAEAVARVLDAAHGPDVDLDGTLAAHVSRSASSRFSRARKRSTTAAVRRWATRSGVAIALVGVSLAVFPLAQQLGVGTSRAAAVSVTETTGAALVTDPDPVPEPLTIGEVTVFGELPTAESAAPPPPPPPRPVAKASPAAAPRPRPAPDFDTPSAAGTAPSESTVTTTPTSTNSPNAGTQAKADADHRALFEERQ